MKRLLIILAALIVAAAGWQLASPKADPTDPSDLSDVSKQPPPTTTVTDPALVFQKAFWRRPSAEDQILNAERREWADKDGISKWEWFLSVKPGPALVDHLITNNAFMLTPSRSGRHEHAEAPEWFPQTPTEATQTLTNATGSFRVLWDKGKNLLHATDSGSGFRPGAPEPVQPVVQNTPSGRLPTTPPPKP